MHGDEVEHSPVVLDEEEALDEEDVVGVAEVVVVVGGT